MDTSRKEAMAKQLWLQYFNRVLFQQGIISQEEWRKMEGKLFRH